MSQYTHENESYGIVGRTIPASIVSIAPVLGLQRTRLLV